MGHPSHSEGCPITQSMEVILQHMPVPSELKSQEQWVLWRNRDGRKEPWQVYRDCPAKSNDRSTWATFDEALATYIPDYHAGLGFVFTSDDPFMGIDLDNCFDEDGNLREWAVEIMERFPTYAEVSPSGNGIKLFARGKSPFGRGRKLSPFDDKSQHIEIYDNGRYFTVTGNAFKDAPSEVVDCQEAVEWLKAKYDKPKPLPAPKPSTKTESATQEDDSTTLAERAAKYVDKMPPAIAGKGGHDQTFAVACCMAIGFELPRADAETILAEYNKRCEPPWSERELSHKLDGAYAQPGTRGELAAWRPGDSDPDNDFKDYGKKERKEVVVPRDIYGMAHKLGDLLGGTGTIYRQDEQIVRRSGVSLLQLKPSGMPYEVAALRNRYKLVRNGEDKEGNPTKVAFELTKHSAGLLSESRGFLDRIPRIVAVSHCPVLVERDGRLEVITGFDRATGIMASGDEPPEMDLQESVSLLSKILDDFDFVTPGDRSRAVAAIITPALVFSGLLGGRSPLDMGEADCSQSGKGYRHKLTAAIYGTKVGAMASNAKGVGSLDESFSSLVLSGAPFIALDNMRSRIDSPVIESFLTEDTATLRIPYRAPVKVGTGRTVVMMTSNQAEATIDLANRSSIVRIQRQPVGYKFAQYEEGDVLSHIKANQAEYLGAVFAVVRHWHKAGKPKSEETGHDFRQWAGVLTWIIQSAFDEAPLLEGHRAAQERIASPNLSWLRHVATTVHLLGLGGEWLRMKELRDAGIAANEDKTDDTKGRVIGRKLASLFRGANFEPITVDGWLCEYELRNDSKYKKRPHVRFAKLAKCEDGASLVDVEDLI